MARFMEKELNNKLKKIENNSLEITLQGCLNGTIIMKDAVVKFDEKTGYINIKNEEQNIKINVTLVYKYEEIKNEIYIKLGNILVKIKKIS